MQTSECAASSTTDSMYVVMWDSNDLYQPDVKLTHTALLVMGLSRSHFASSEGIMLMC